MINQKLKNLPTIYYTNLDHRVERKEYMESQFKKLGITNYKRISSSKYSSKNVDVWIDKILDKNPEDIIYGINMVAHSLTHLEIIKDWLDNTEEDYLLLMEDDYDLSLIEKWQFTWNDLINNLPDDWDCILLGYETDRVIHFFLHPTSNYHTFGPCLINRWYAEKIVRMHHFDGKYLINSNVADLKIKPRSGFIDYLIQDFGKSYAIPLITCNPDFESDNGYDEYLFSYQRASRDLYYKWWKNESHKYTKEQMFTYNKEEDFIMTERVVLNNRKNKLRYQ